MDDSLSTLNNLNHFSQLRLNCNLKIMALNNIFSVLLHNYQDRILANRINEWNSFNL